MDQKIAVYTGIGKDNITPEKLIKQYEIVFYDNNVFDRIATKCEYTYYEDKDEHIYFFDKYNFTSIYNVIKELCRVCRYNEKVILDLLHFDENDFKDLSNAFMMLQEIVNNVIPSLERGEYLPDEVYFDNVLPDGFVPGEDESCIVIGYYVY